MLKLARGFTAGLPVSPALQQVRIRLSERTNWCWAACFQMLLELLEQSVRKQCEVAEPVLGVKNPACCHNVNACNFALDHMRVGKALGFFGLKSRFSPSPLSLNDLKNALPGGPIAIGLARGALGHMLLAVDTSEQGGNTMIDILDPKFGVGSVTYAFLLSGHSLGSWKWTWDVIEAMGGNENG